MASRGNILLVSVNTEEQPYPVYPLALDYLRGPLQQVGYKTRTWDARTDEDLVTLMQAFRPDVALVSIRNADNNDSANTNRCQSSRINPAISASSIASSPVTAINGLFTPIRFRYLHNAFMVTLLSSTTITFNSTSLFAMP